MDTFFDYEVELIRSALERDARHHEAQALNEPEFALTHTYTAWRERRIADALAETGITYTPPHERPHLRLV